MQLEFLFAPERGRAVTSEEALRTGPPLAVQFVRNPQARRYILRVRADRVVRVTIPRGGSLEQARQFATRHTTWIARQIQRCEARSPQPTGWSIGTQIYYRGKCVPLERASDGRPLTVHFGDQRLQISDTGGSLRPVIERHLWGLAAVELPARVLELAARHQLEVRRVVVRNQSSRWGSCSPTGSISLNWRLIQTPPFVRDYIVLHELMHLRHMNHSRRFWRAVDQACPQRPEAERWLKQHRDLLR